MLFSKHSALAVGLLLPAVFAAPGAPYSAPAPNQDVNDALIKSLEAYRLGEGRINFQATVNQKCISQDPLTSITVEAVLDGTGKVIAKAGSSAMLSSDPVPLFGLPVELWASFQDDAVNFNFENSTVVVKQGAKYTEAFFCTVGDWSAALNCNAADSKYASRMQEIDCLFETDTSKDTAQNIQARADTEASNIFASSATGISGDALTSAYAHGYCSFRMQNFQQCMFTPKENWHTEIMGDLYSIQDNDLKTIVSYPDGAGRIDGQIKHLTNIDDGLWMTYQNDITYFRFGNGLWDTTTKDDGHEYGLCQTSAWSTGAIQCTGDHAGQYRLQNIVCIFKC